MTTDPISSPALLPALNVANTTTPVVHRVYDIAGEGDTKVFITKGDANDEPDTEPILADNIIGKAVFNIPKIGWIPIAVKSLISKIGFNI